MKETYYMFNEIVSDDRGLIAYNISLDELNSGTYSSEEILSMVLRHAKELSET